MYLDENGFATVHFWCNTTGLKCGPLHSMNDNMYDSAFSLQCSIIPHLKGLIHICLELDFKDNSCPLKQPSLYFIKRQKRVFLQGTAVEYLQPQCRKCSILQIKADIMFD